MIPPEPRERALDALRPLAQSTTGPGEIMISEPLYKALKKKPKVEASEPLPLKGKAQPVPAYRVKL